MFSGRDSRLFDAVVERVFELAPGFAEVEALYAARTVLTPSLNQ
jgi:hypothetical protein